VAAISVDPPERSAAMRSDLGLNFPVLSDSSREVITSWGLLNASEKGGIAFPATFLIDRDLTVRFSSAEESVMRRVPAFEMLEMVRALKAGRSAEPRSKTVHPGWMFIRSILNGLRRGVIAKRP
jgi:peroxiredoxin